MDAAIIASCMRWSNGRQKWLVNLEKAWPSRRRTTGDPEGKVKSKEASYCFMRVARGRALSAGCGFVCSSIFARWVFGRQGVNFQAF